MYVLSMASMETFILQTSKSVPIGSVRLQARVIIKDSLVFITKPS